MSIIYFDDRSRWHRRLCLGCRERTKNADGHGVGQAGVERGFFNDTLLLLKDARHSVFETRFHALGKTSAGRRLHVTFTLRRCNALIRVISARDMHRKERDIYEKGG